MNNKVAVIDLGTNSLITLIAEKVDNEINIIEENYQIIRLGEGLAITGKISENAVQRCIEGFEKVNVLINDHKIKKINCVATSALRDAKNGNEIISKLERKFKIQIKVISGIDEAKLVSYATMREFYLKTNKTLIFDIGGGSTEFIYLINNKINYNESLQIGAVRCTEAFLKSDPVLDKEILKYENYIDGILAKIPNFNLDEAIGIAGTVTTLASVNIGLEKYDSGKIHKSEIDITSVQKIKNQFQNANLEERKQIIGLDSKRAEVILAGTIICLQIMKKFNLNKIKVSDKGLRWGQLYQEFD